MSSIFKHISLVLIAALLAFFSATYFGALYCYMSGECNPATASIGFTPYIGLFFGYLFLESVLLAGFGGKYRYVWIVVVTLPLLGWFIANSVGISEFVWFVATVIAGALVGESMRFLIMLRKR